MARPREFDRRIVLEHAMNVFWSKGYECASMQDLIDAMGINRGSLYATFGDKRALHLEALGHFQKTQLLAMMTPLSRPGSKLAAIREIFEAVTNCACDGDGNRRGCMMYNTAVEFCPEDSEVNTLVAQGLKRIEACFLDALVEAQIDGEIAAAKDVTALSRHLTNSFNGLRVMCMVFDDRDTLDDIVNISLAALD